MSADSSCQIVCFASTSSRWWLWRIPTCVIQLECIAADDNSEMGNCVWFIVYKDIYNGILLDLFRWKIKLFKQ